MPKVSFDGVPDAGGDFQPIPDGTYTMRIDSVEAKETRKGDPMFKLTLKVIDGEYTNRLVWDNLVFNSKAMGRVKKLCGAIGLPTKGEVDITPDKLEGKEVRVDVVVEEREWEGQKRTDNTVQFAGYHAIREPGDDTEDEAAF